jgi:hypothetical protein
MFVRDARVALVLKTISGRNPEFAKFGFPHISTKTSATITEKIHTTQNLTMATLLSPYVLSNRLQNSYNASIILLGTYGRKIASKDDE